MNCGTCRECKIKMWVFGNVGFFEIFEFFRFFDFFDVFVKEIVIFNIGFGFVVLKSIW